MELLSPTDISKIHLHMEHSSLKSGRTINQSCKKDLHVINWVGRGKRRRLGSAPGLLGGICKEKVHKGRPLPWGVSRSSHNMGIPVLGSCMEWPGRLASWEIC